MSRINLDPIMTFPDGSLLVVSTLCSKVGEFSCTLYNAVVREDDEAAFQVLSNDLSADTCLAAQDYVYSYAVRLYPQSVGVMKKPPYLVWSGPRSAAPAQ